MFVKSYFLFFNVIYCSGDNKKKKAIDTTKGDYGSTDGHNSKKASKTTKGNYGSQNGHSLKEASEKIKVDHRSANGYDSISDNGSIIEKLDNHSNDSEEGLSTSTDCEAAISSANDNDTSVDSESYQENDYDTAELGNVLRESLEAPNSAVRKAANRLLETTTVLEEELNEKDDEQITYNGDDDVDFSSMQPMGYDSDELQEASETTSLLAHTNEALRPSVFTAVVDYDVPKN